MVRQDEDSTDHDQLPNPGSRRPGDLTPLNQPGRTELARYLPDIPSMVIPNQTIRRGLGCVFLEGSASQPKAVLVQPPGSQTELMVLGSDPEAIVALLSRLPGWDCVSLPSQLASPVAERIRKNLGLEAAVHADLFYILDQPPHSREVPHVRLLRPGDSAFVDQSDAMFHDPAFRDLSHMLAEAIVACGIVDGKIVSMAEAGSITETYADVGIRTLEPYRNRGLATSAAYLVVSEVCKQGRSPIWSTLDTNRASQRVAEKLGFRPLPSEAVLLFPTLQASGGFEVGRKAPTSNPL